MFRNLYCHEYTYTQYTVRTYRVHIFQQVSAVPIHYSMAHLPDVTITTTAATRQWRHPPKNWNRRTESFTSIQFYKSPTNDSLNNGDVENAPTSSASLSPPPPDRECCSRCNLIIMHVCFWSRLFRYVAKMAAVECEKCTMFHTLNFGRYEYTSGSFRYTSFSPQS